MRLAGRVRAAAGDSSGSVVASFFVLQGPDKGRSLRSAEDRILIGRTSDQIPLTDHTVSRRHAQVDAAEGGWVLSDLDSANGTYVNGVRVTRPVKLKHGDQIRVGSTLLVYAGDERVEQLLGPNIPTDLVTLDAGESLDASIMASVPSNEDSVVMAAPDTAWAVKSWNVIRQLTDVIGSLLPTDQLLARVMDIIFEEVEADRGVIFVRDPQTHELMPEVVRFRERAGKDRGRDGDAIQTSRTILDHVARSREGVLCSNVAADKRFQSGKSVHNLGMRSVICAPIVAREQVLGVVHLDCPVPRHTYNENELRLITAIGYQTGLAIENARLVQSHLERERLAAAGETVAYLSHYIKNILQGMRSGADVVKRGLDRRDFAVTSQGWHVVERNLEKSYNLMLNMLAFSKEREPRFEMLQLNKIVDEVVDLAQRPADDRKAVLLADLDDHVPAIPLDYDGIHQVILNLITNALEIVPPGNGIVNVRTRYEAAAKQVVLSVADNGPGVPPQNQQRIFEPFFSTKGHGGTGLGLAVAKKIVEELGGTIEVRNQPEGGAEFRVKLPAFNTRMEQSGDTLGPR